MQEPADSKDHVVPVLGEGAADEVHTDDVQWRDEPDDDEARFRDNDTAVAAHVHVADEVMEPMPADLGEDGAEDGRDVNGSKLVVGKLVFRHDEDGDCDVIANDPSEGEEVVDRGDQDRKL